MNHFFANVNEVLQELWNVDFFRVAFALIVFLLIANIIREIVKEIKKSKIKRKAKRISRHGADLYGDSLWITKRNPYFAKIIKIIPHKMNITAYKPESYVYTGATVGGITTGGFHKEGGYNYIASTIKTEKCALVFGRKKGVEIKSIYLTPELAKEARKSFTIKDYVTDSNYIMVENEIEISDYEKKLFFESAKANSPSHYNIASRHAYERAPDRAKCEAILEWICGK